MTSEDGNQAGNMFRGWDQSSGRGGRAGAGGEERRVGKGCGSVSRCPLHCAGARHHEAPPQSPEDRSLSRDWSAVKTNGNGFYEETK